MQVIVARSQDTFDPSPCVLEQVTSCLLCKSGPEIPPTRKEGLLPVLCDRAWQSSNEAFSERPLDSGKCYRHAGVLLLLRWNSVDLCMAPWNAVSWNDVSWHQHHHFGFARFARNMCTHGRWGRREASLDYKSSPLLGFMCLHSSRMCSEAGSQP